MPMTKLTGVTKRYGKTLAMDNVSLEIPAGSVFALLGENGAGKTTTIKSLLGLERPDRGLIDVLGMDPLKDGIEIRRQVGYVPDAPMLYDWMKVSQIGWFASGFYEEGYLDEFERLAKEFDLPLDRKIKQLSKGGRAKVTLALAMSHRPQLLILDEPTSGLDTMVRRKFLESMVDVAAEGRTVLLSSHQIPEVERVADIVAIMNEGKIRVCERLDILKQQIERWVVSVNSPNVGLPNFDAFLLTHDGAGERRQQFIVRNPDPNALWQLRDIEGVLEVEVHTPSLEEIFVAYLSSNCIETSPAQKLESEAKGSAGVRSSEQEA